ncbi:DUF1329 domain-containing protein [Solimonas sp. K1W22B-7]|uniref:DUF1329 domain-containing protein n=1 Tax=Solimonas sp. K1W22B-7 TaxID=2303331 RepID=UPI000E331F81|nr:DUF1329 domain-containing protein [Solimonas sp. K1W22B-7]AXQ31112.1 DUF1329 domain-containing protein [Solimonas sp. K1W22B-7]
MNTPHTGLRILLVSLGLIAAPLAHAKVTAAEAARLGKELTPIGAEPAANKDGTIPAWAPAARRGALKGEYPSNPAFDAEKPLFTITKANMGQYADKLSEGHRKLLSTYDSYKMNVYPGHRPITVPDFVQKATAANATTCTLVDVDTLDNCKVGFPFPVPKSGAEVIWNHKLKYRGEGARRYNNQMIVQTNGEFQLTKIVEEAKFYYAVEKNPVPLTKDSGLFLKYFSQTIAPPRLAGTMILVHERAGSGNSGRAAWLYSPGLKRIRRAPTVCCDNPYEGTDGHQFYDQVDMFNGAMERYDWKLIGKKEMFIPYNSNRIGSNKVKYKDLAKPKHLNQDLPRYELHRVWVVEANIRPGTSHTFAKRRYYVDEDSWAVAAVDDYDNRQQLYQFQEGHIVFAYSILATGTIPEVIYHFNSGRYFLTAMANEDQPNDLTVRLDDSYFESSAVQKRSTK